MVFSGMATWSSFPPNVNSTEWAVCLVLVFLLLTNFVTVHMLELASKQKLVLNKQEISIFNL